MGRKPKALKDRKITAKEASIIKQSINKDKKSNHISFDENENAGIPEDSSEQINMPESQIKEETDEPEIVTSNDLSIQKLKELYDSINTINVEKKTKKRKAQGSTNSIRKKANIDEPFDISLLNQSDELKGDSAVKTDAESLAPRVFNNAQMTENQPKKKKIGHIEIVALDHKVDFFSDFKLNKSTENFLNSMKDDKRRVRYGLFSSLKKAQPARSFCKKS